jgi:hypothetical protein
MALIIGVLPAADSPFNVHENSVLLVSTRIEDHNSLNNILTRPQWELRCVWSDYDAAATVRRTDGELPVVVCEHTSHSDGWKRLLEVFAKLRNPPKLVVCANNADERLWAEVLNLGAYDLLQGAPFDPEEVRRVIQNACSSWNRPARRMALAASNAT